MKNKVRNEEDKNEITVSVDRIKLTLERYRSGKSIVGELVSYFGIILSLVITLLTTSFKDTWIFSAESLNIIFIVLLAVLIFVFCVRFVYFIYLKKKGNISEEWFIDTLQYKSAAPKARNNNKIKNIIAFLIEFILYVLLPIGAFVGFGFLSKWHWAYCVFAGLLLFSICIGLWSEWNEFADTIYKWLCKFDKKDD